MTKPSLFETDIERSAAISPCGLYRYTLGRRWGAGKTVNFVMLNPSTADADIDDPTIRRCVGFAKGWGFNALVVTNLFAFRATDPKEMRLAADPVGPQNDFHLMLQSRLAHLVVCAWGNHGTLLGRSKAVREMLTIVSQPQCLRLSKTGEPVHPLYMPGSLTPQPIGAAS